MINNYAGSMDIVIQQAGSDSPCHYHDSSSTRFCQSFDNAYVTGHIRGKNITIGQTAISSSDQDNVLLPGQTGSDLTVTRDMVGGAGMFTAKLLLNGTPVV